MIPRIGLDLGTGFDIADILPDVDLLDAAYGAAHGGAGALMIPYREKGRQGSHTADQFKRAGLPPLTVRIEQDYLDQAASLGSAPDRMLILGDRSKCLLDMTQAAEFVERLGEASQETAVYVEPEPAILREASRARVKWVFFPTEFVWAAESPEEAEAEIARLCSASVAASKIGLRIALMGRTGRHLPSALSRIPRVEEIFPVPELWEMALRLGWERAIVEYRELMR